MDNFICFTDEFTLTTLLHHVMFNERTKVQRKAKQKKEGLEGLSFLSSLTAEKKLHSPLTVTDFLPSLYSQANLLQKEDNSFNLCIPALL